MFRNQSVNVHQFSMVPRADIPRSSFRVETTHKTVFDAGWLIPVYVDEVLPGDSVSLRMTAFARMSTPLFPIMDNLRLDSFWFFCPLRLVWSNFQKFMGEQENPGDSTDFIIPVTQSPVGGYPIGSIFDYMGLPTVGQVGATHSVSHSSLPLRAYLRTWSDWFRDQNLQDSPVVPTGDGPDSQSLFALRRRGKRHDYFTSCLPWPQKGEEVLLPLGDSAPISLTQPTTNNPQTVRFATTYGTAANLTALASGAGGELKANTTGGTNIVIDPAGTLVADLSAATAATINQLRQAFQVQKLLERDARGGTRYVELVLAHFGVRSADQRLQRVEFLGSGSTVVNVNPIAQTSATGIQGGTTPQGTLGAMATAVAGGHGFSQSFTEHGILLGLVCVRADLTYQQGLRRMWSRSTKYDFYWPAFAALGEEPVYQREIYCTGDAAQDGKVFGYQERWSSYRYFPSMITSLFRSTADQTLDGWHLAQHFTVPPTLNQTFIEENPPLERVLAVGAAANGQHFIFDSFFSINMARAMPMYSVPGLIDHF